MAYNHNIIFGAAPDFKQQQLQNALLQFVTGTLSYSSTLGTFTTGQIFFSEYLGVPCYISSDGQVQPMAGNWSTIFGDTALENQPLLLGTDSSLTYTSNATINANQFYGSGLVPVAVGGTSSSGLFATAVLVGNDIGPVQTTGLYYYANSGSLGINSKAYLASINIGGTASEKKILLSLNKRSLMTIPIDNTVEYDGSGYYYTTDWGTRRLLATTDDSLATSFGGVLPLSKGGTNNTSYTHGTLVQVSGSTFVGLEGGGSGCVPEWNGTKWITSTTGYITKGPLTANQNTIIGQAAVAVPLTLRNISPTGLALRIQNSGGLTTFSVDSSGDVYYRRAIYPERNNASSQPYISVIAVSGQPGPFIRMHGGIGIGSTRVPAGSINTSSDGLAADTSGGSILTYGSNYAGGNIYTYDGGGSINTRGSGLLELGETGTRTILIGGAVTSNKTVRFPNQNGIIPVVSTNFTSGHYVRYNNSGFVLTSGDVGGVGGGITSINGVTASVQTLSLLVSGVSLAIVSSADDNKILFPIASGSNTYAGLLSSGHWHLFNDKLSTGHITADDHTQYVITRPSVSGRNYVYSSGDVPAITIQESTPSASTLFRVRASGGTDLFSIGANGAIAYNSFTIKGTAFDIITTDATSNVSHYLPDQQGHILVADTSPLDSSYAAFASDTISGAVTFAKIPNPRHARREFGTYPTPLTANTRTTIGMVALTPSAALTLANDHIAPYQRLTAVAGGEENMVTSEYYRVQWLPDVTLSMRPSGTIPSGGWKFGFSEGGALSSDPSFINASLLLVYDRTVHSGATPTWRAVYNRNSATNATTVDTAVPVVATGTLLRINVVSTGSVEFYIDGTLAHTATGNIPAYNETLDLGLAVLGVDGLNKGLDFNWLQGEHY